MQVILFILTTISQLFFLVRRVHWLRARAQFMRWQEEVTLNTYEMQWTVRYFRHMNIKWTIPDRPGNKNPGSNPDSYPGPGPGLDSQSFAPNDYPPSILSDGAIAYWKRKQSVWEHMMLKADSIFSTTNSAYQSPL